MKLKQNVVMRFVFEPEELNRVVAVFSLLISIDKRMNKNKKSSKKVAVKKQKEDSTPDGYDRRGSPKKRASVILCGILKNPEITDYYDRYYYTHHSSFSFFYYQA